uniref:Uncharacterized protein n=1 Tax=Opuntia streptacantha TaxID=393608 RepID=A0A7C9EJQ7_OPUST
MMLRAVLVSPYFESCSFSLKLFKVRSCVISLYSSSLNVENTFKSVTSISTAFALSCRSRASRYFCFLISKNIFIEYLLSSTLVNPDKYFSTSSHSPAWTFSSKYFMLKRNPDSCSSL